MRPLPCPPPYLPFLSLPEALVVVDEAFLPRAYLTHVHAESSAAQLQHGRALLLAAVEKERQQLRELVKGNFGCFISCKTNIDGEGGSEGVSGCQ